MLLQSLSTQEIAARAGGAGLGIACGPTVTRLVTRIPDLLKDLRDVYRDYTVVDLDETGADVCVDMRYTSLLRRFIRPQITGLADRPGPFAPLPPDISFVGYEMAQNWHIANTHNRHVMFHAACVASAAGETILMPGMSGSGKSTLGVAMGFRQWRFLGDEFALFDGKASVFKAVPRPASLKNQSIDVLKAWAPEGGFSRVFEETPKGRMAYLRPPKNALEEDHPPARLSMVVFPRFVADVEPAARRLRAAEALVELTNACVNFERLGQSAFDLLAAWATDVPVFQITYPSLAGACDMITAIEERLRQTRS